MTPDTTRPPVKESLWIKTNGKEPRGWSSHDFLWVVWYDDSIDCIEAYGSILWQDIKYYQPVVAPNPPNEIYD